MRLWLLAAVTLVAACAKNDGDEATIEASAEIKPTEAARTAQSEEAAANRAESERFLADNAKREGVKRTASGLQYEILAEGGEGGVSPEPEDIVEVHYVGTLIDGTEFDSSHARGAAARFQLGRVIPGWIEGLQLMSEGDRYRFYIPSDLAYGQEGRPGSPIGPNAALIFDVELLGVANAERNAAKSAQFLAANAKKPGVKATPSGLQYESLAEGPAGGAKPTDESRVVAHYVAMLVSGEEIDSTRRAPAPPEFMLTQFPVEGVVEGLQLMSAGDTYRFVVPPELAFGAQGTPDSLVGPNEALVFEVELVEVK
jgi:FKBP-type peptidyl-prolyl cis-trans isomerase